MKALYCVGFQNLRTIRAQLYHLLTPLHLKKNNWFWFLFLTWKISIYTRQKLNLEFSISSKETEAIQIIQIILKLFKSFNWLQDWGHMLITNFHKVIPELEPKEPYPTQMHSLTFHLVEVALPLPIDLKEPWSNPTFPRMVHNYSYFTNLFLSSTSWQEQTSLLLENGWAFLTRWWLRWLGDLRQAVQCNHNDAFTHMSRRHPHTVLWLHCFNSAWLESNL